MSSDQTNARYLTNALMGLLLRTLDPNKGGLDPTVAYSAVIHIAKRGREPVDEAWTQLLTKCVLKIGKSMTEEYAKGVAGSNPDFATLLREVHDFLVELPPWQRRQDADVSLRFRSVKTLVHEITVLGAVDLSLVDGDSVGAGGIGDLLRELCAEAGPVRRAPLMLTFHTARYCLSIVSIVSVLSQYCLLLLLVAVDLT